MIDRHQQNNMYCSEIDVHRPVRARPGVRVKYVNEKLEEAIEDVKSKISLRKKSQSETCSKKPETLKSKTKMVLFTETFKKKYEMRLEEVHQRRRQLQEKSLSNQMKARLSKKIKQNIQLRQKKDLIKDIQERRIQKELEKQSLTKRKKQEQKLLHQSNLDRIYMLRKSKSQVNKREIKISKVSSQESLECLRFKQYLGNKEKQDHKIFLKTKQQFMIRAKSSKNIRNSYFSTYSQKNHQKNVRSIQTSQVPRNQRIQKQDGQEQIIYQYMPKTTQQKRLNPGVSTPKESNKKQPQQKNIQNSQQKKQQKEDNIVEKIL